LKKIGNILRKEGRAVLDPKSYLIGYFAAWNWTFSRRN